ncbi:hypothetical protein YC2023_047791 [Brassica napus]
MVLSDDYLWYYELDYLEILIAHACAKLKEDRGILHSVPEGLRKVLNYIKDKYNNPTVYIKENGINDYDDGRKSRGDILNDTFRIKYHEDHLQQLYKAIM